MDMVIVRDGKEGQRVGISDDRRVTNHRELEREGQKEGAVRVLAVLQRHHCAQHPPSQFEWNRRQVQ